jgi:high-affinity nickel-transport protein
VGFTLDERPLLDLALAFVTSLLLGMRHATDPDHIVAVSTIVSRERSLAQAGAIGVSWGLGHTITILVVGTCIIVFKLALTPVFGLSLEMTVAGMLMVLGTLNLVRAQSPGTVVSTVRPFAVGVVHGLAGSAAAVLLVLPLIGDVRFAFLYLVVFGLGTVVGMALVTAAIAAPAMLASRRIDGLHHTIRFAFGGISLAFGVYLAWRIGFADGLLTAQAHWTPR